MTNQAEDAAEHPMSLWVIRAVVGMSGVGEDRKLSLIMICGRLERQHVFPARRLSRHPTHSGDVD
jgi:hypothetical protein